MTIKKINDFAKVNVMAELASDQPLGNVAERGSAIYESIKGEYEPANKGKFLAIEVQKKKVYLGDTIGEALNQARAENPDRSFYVCKIGFDVLETLATPFGGDL